MLSENRKYDFVGELNFHKSKVVNAPKQPKDDHVNWLFLNAGEKQFSFVYKIKKPQLAVYEKPFKADLAFTIIETVNNIIRLNKTYEVLRGQEVIGTVKSDSTLD